MSKKNDESGPFFRGAEVEVCIGNFSISIKSTKGDDVVSLTKTAMSVYEYALLLNNAKEDKGVQ